MYISDWIFSAMVFFHRSLLLAFTRYKLFLSSCTNTSFSLLMWFTKPKGRQVLLVSSFRVHKLLSVLLLFSGSFKNCSRNLKFFWSLMREYEKCLKPSRALSLLPDLKLKTEFISAVFKTGDV